MIDAKDEVILRLIKVIETYQKITRINGMIYDSPSLQSLDKLATDIINIVKK